MIRRTSLFERDFQHQVLFGSYYKKYKDENGWVDYFEFQSSVYGIAYNMLLTSRIFMAKLRSENRD